MRSADTLKIRVSGLSEGVHEYHFDADPVEIGLEDRFQHPVSVDAKLDKSNRQLYLTVSVTVTGGFQCDRCVEDFSRLVSSRYQVFYVYDEIDTGRFNADEVRIISIDETHIDLTDDVRETVLLSVPFKLLCKEDCQGLCPRCGINKNTATCTCRAEEADSPWTELRKLKND
jgi:uncharacterized protein